MILNSVVQYFPDAAYLVRVIRGALSLLAPRRTTCSSATYAISSCSTRCTPRSCCTGCRPAPRAHPAPAGRPADGARGGTPRPPRAVPGGGRHRRRRHRPGQDLAVPQRTDPLPLRRGPHRPAGRGTPAPAADWRAWPGPAALPGDGGPGAHGWRAVPDARLGADLRAVRALHAAGDDETVDGSATHAGRRPRGARGRPGRPRRTPPARPAS
ncbi:hypothetical protein LT493_16440 [Streptomyces tricolor]|nr:hypothetical protein [Streptomyces tricolor]